MCGVDGSWAVVGVKDLLRAAESSTWRFVSRSTIHTFNSTGHRAIGAGGSGHREAQPTPTFELLWILTTFVTLSTFAAFSPAILDTSARIFDKWSHEIDRLGALLWKK